MTKADYKHFAKRKLSEHGIDGWTIEFSSRMKKNVGKAVFRSKTRRRVIVLSEPWFVDFESIIDNEEELKDVILHEIAHVLDYERRGTSGHKRKWKKCAREVGADPTRTTDAIPHSLFKQVADWKRVCPKCGKAAGYYFSRPTAKHYMCAGCHSKGDSRAKRQEYMLEIKRNR